MDGAWLHRARWRWRGAWLWPLFVATIVFDGAIAVVRPFDGDRQSFYAGMLTGMVANLLAVILLARPLGLLLRRARRDLPGKVARNYGGSAVVLGVSAILLAIGLVNHISIAARASELRDAVVRAEAYIGDHAPAEFRVNMLHPDTFTIEAGVAYRTCVPGRRSGRFWCVIVRPRLPFARSVLPAGGEPNALFSQGVD